jgi:hypothetical protein
MKIVGEEMILAKAQSSQSSEYWICFYFAPSRLCGKISSIRFCSSENAHGDANAAVGEVPDLP